MDEQLFCSKCGRVNVSRWFDPCVCKEPDFRFKTHEEYLRYRNAKQPEGDKSARRLDITERYYLPNGDWLTVYMDINEHLIFIVTDKDSKTVAITTSY